MTVIASAVI